MIMFLSANVPLKYFPKDVTLFNAYAIHGSVKGEANPPPENFVYESLFPVSPGEIPAPNFHYLRAFGEIDLTEVTLIK
jgi:hypothetical protein